MYRKPTKKQILFRRLTVFVLSIISVVVIVLITMLFILGYRLDSVHGRLEQGALVQFDSVPSGASVTIDGDSTGTQTATKRSVLAGEHTFMMTRDGYRPWSRTVTLEAGTLTWLDYVRLVPEELSKQTVRSYDAVAAVKASPDKQTIIVQQTQDKPVFEVIDIRSQDVKSTSQRLPDDVVTDVNTEGVTHRYVLDKWDADGRYILVKHTYDDKSEWLVFDTDNVTASRNITQLLSLDLSDVQFASTNGNVLYGLSEGVIRKLDLQNATISRGLVSRVSTFSMYENSTLTYVGKNDEEHQVVGLYRDGDQFPHILRTVEDTNVKLRADTTRYYSNDYVVISQDDEVTILKGRYPTSNQTDTQSLAVLRTFGTDGTVDQLNFSDDGDYVLARAGLSFSTYELEHDWLHREKIETKGNENRALSWLDDAHLAASYDGHLTIRDFDGTNVNVIMPIIAGTDATLSQNGKYIYGVNKTDEIYRLERVKMILD